MIETKAVDPFQFPVFYGAVSSSCTIEHGVNIYIFSVKVLLCIVIWTCKYLVARFAIKYQKFLNFGIPFVMASKVS